MEMLKRVYSELEITYLMKQSAFVTKAIKKKQLSIVTKNETEKKIIGDDDILHCTEITTFPNLYILSSNTGHFS